MRLVRYLFFDVLTDGYVCGLGDNSQNEHVCGAQLYLINGQLFWSGDHTARRAERLSHVIE